MNLTLFRSAYVSDGIFGELNSEDGSFQCVCLEHAYLIRGFWTPKLPKGTYRCVRGVHRLDDSKPPFVTFEVTNVPGHTGILFHSGNFNSDSQGCILLGHTIIDRGDGTEMITSSRETFAMFLILQQDVNEFELTVE